MKHCLPLAWCLLTCALVVAPVLAEDGEPAAVCMEPAAVEAPLLAPPGPSQGAELLDPLAEAFQAVWACSSHADCPCLPPACYCTLRNICICNQNLCCPGGECP